MTTILKKHADSMAKVVGLLRDGAVGILPTDNVYGLVTNGSHPDSVERIYALKGRDRSKPLCYYTTPELAANWGRLDARARRITATWPSAVSLIVPRKDSVPDYITRGLDSVLLVCIDPFVEALARLADFPIVATSANISDQPPITDFNDARQQFEGRVDFILDGGVSQKGSASTMVNLSVEPPFIQRQGPVSAETLKRMIPELIIP